MSSILVILKKLWPSRVRNQLILGVVLLHAVVMSIFVVDIVNRQRRFLKKQNHDQTFSFVNDFAINSTSYLVADDFDELERLVISHINYPNLKYAMILSPEGVVLAHTNANYIGKRPIDKISLKLNGSSTTTTLIENDNLLDIAVPIIVDKKAIGWARVGVGQEFIQNNLDTIVRDGLIYITLALLIATLFAVFIGNTLNTGLYRLISTVNKIKGGDRNVRVAPFWTSELSELAMAFNRMLDDISTNENLLSLVIESLPVGVWIFDEKREFLSNNSAGREIWGGSKFIGKNQPALYKAWHADTKKMLEPHNWASVRAIEKGETTINEELEIETIDKKHKIILNSAIPLKGNAGQIIGAIAINVDITERKKITEQLALSESTLSNAFDYSAIGMTLVSPSGRFLRVNKSLCALIGYPEKELLSLTFQDITHPDDLEADLVLVKQTLSGQINSYRMEKRYFHKSGKIIWIHLSVSLVRDKENQPLFFISQIEDISERKKIIEQLSLSESVLSSAFDYSAIGMAMVSPDGKFLRVNKQLSRMLGYPEQQLLNLTFQEITYAEDLGEDLGYLQQTLKGEIDSFQMEKRYLRKDGTIIWTHLSVSLVRDRNAQPLFFVSQVEDISERKRSEAIILHEKNLSETVINAMPGIFYLSSRNGMLIRWNTNLEIITGFSRSEISTMRNTDFFDQDKVDYILTKRKEAFLTGKAAAEVEIVTKQNQKLPYYVTVIPVLYNNEQCILGIGIDFTEKKMAERTILQFNRLYQFTSAINDMMLHAENKQSIFSEACQVAITQGQFSMAWIGNYSGPGGRIEVYAEAGNNSGYLETLQSGITLEDFKVGSFAKAILEKKPVYVNDIAGQTFLQSWKEEMLKRDYQSIISLPIVVGSRLEAVFTLYRSEAFFFNDEEVKLLQEVTNNIAYAVEKLESKQLQKQAEEQLKESEEKFRTLVEETMAGVFILQDGKLVYVNPQCERIFGYSRDELLSTISLEQLINKEDLEKAWDHYSSETHDKSKNHYFLKAKGSDGAALQVEVIASTIAYVGKPAVIGTVIDITEQVAEEKRISKAVSDAQENERQQISMELHDSVKQMMAASLLNIDFLKMLLKEESTASPIINNTKNYIREAIEELRRISHQLAPSIDESVSLEEKIKTVVSTMNVSNGLEVSYHFDRFEQPIRTDVQLAMFRILQEQFSNILKYANASVVDITVQRQNGHIAMSIQDNGLGFDTAFKKHGIGLENIKRRVQVFNGHFNIQSSPGNGCKLDVQIPVN